MRAVYRKLASSAETRRSHPGVIPGSTRGQPGANLQRPTSHAVSAADHAARTSSLSSATLYSAGTPTRHPHSGCGPFDEGLADIAHHAIGCRITQQTTVQNSCRRRVIDSDGRIREHTPGSTVMDALSTKLFAVTSGGGGLGGGGGRYLQGPTLDLVKPRTPPSPSPPFSPWLIPVTPRDASSLSSRGSPRIDVASSGSRPCCSGAS